MINNLPISPNKRFKYSITFESWDEDSLEMGKTDVRGYIEQDELDAIGDILYEANTTYGIYMPFAFGRWESTYPDEDADYFEKGIRKFYFLEITNEDGTQISDEESDFITFLLSDGRYELNKFRDYAVGGIVLGSIVLGVGALITYFYFKDKKPNENKAVKSSTNKVKESSLNSRAKSVTHNINGVDKKFPIKDAWRKEHKIENKSQDFEVPQGEREPLTYADGGDISSYYDDVEFGTGGVAKTKEIITKKIGLSEENADFLIYKSEKYAIWLADAIIKAQLNIVKEITKEQAVKFLNNDTNILKGLSQRITGILDWLKSPNLPQQNLRELTFAEAERKSKIWHDELSVSGGDIDFTEPKENIVLKAYPKNEFGKTYYWVLLPSNTCRLESSRMGHCGQSGKSDNLISFRSDYVNSKGENINDSHITIAYGDGYFYQVKGKQNKKPAEKYFPYIFDFIKSFVKGEIEDLTFNGFASEYQSKEDYGWEDMTKQELTELYELNPDLFSDFAGKYMLYEAGLSVEKPNTTIVIEKSPEYVADLLRLDRDLSEEVVEKVLTGETDDWFSGSDSWGYYYDNADDYVHNLNEANYEAVIDKIVEITGLEKSVVKENGAKHYLAGDDEEFDKDNFDDISRAIASAMTNGEENAYVKYYYEQIESALSELGTIKKLNYDGVEIEIDLLDKMSIGGISSYMKDLETEYLEDVFFEAENQGDIELPDLSIDDRYSPSIEDEDFNANFDIDNYSKGGSLRPKNISSNKKTKIKNMKPNQRKFADGGEIKSFILNHNQLSSRENMHIGFNKGDLMKMAYGETYQNVDSALPLGLLDEMGIGNENYWHYVMDYNGNSFGEVTDLFEKINLKNPNVEVFNTDYESIEILPISEASKKYANQEVLFQLAKNSDKFAEGGDLGVSKEDYFNVVKNWVYFTFNYPMGFVKDAFNSEHLRGKFSSAYDNYGSRGVLPIFWANLSGNNREILALWIKNNYFNEIEYKSKLQSISDDDYANIISHWNMFCLNFPYRFVSQVFLGNTSHYEQKWSRANERGGSAGAVNVFFTELDFGNQILLTDFASDIKKFADGGEAGEKSTKNIRKKRPKTRQPKMVRQYFEDEAYDYAVGGRVTSRSGIIEVFLTSNRQLTVGNLSTHFNEYDNQMLLRNYGTLIATRKGNDVDITNVKYSQTTSRITNELNSMANQKGMNVSYVDKFADGGVIFQVGDMVKIMPNYVSHYTNSKAEIIKVMPDNKTYEVKIKHKTGNEYVKFDKSELVFLGNQNKFADGGEIIFFDRQASMDSETRDELIEMTSYPLLKEYFEGEDGDKKYESIKSALEREGVSTFTIQNYLSGLYDGYNYSNTEGFKKEMAKLKLADKYFYDKVMSLYNKVSTYPKIERNYKDGGKLGADSKTKIEITDSQEGGKIATRTLVKKNQEGESITYELTVGVFKDRKKGYFEIYATDSEDEEYFYAEGGLWIEGGKVVDYDGVYELSEKLRPLMSALNLNTQDVYAEGGMIEHGLREGDKIVFDHLRDENIDIIDKDGNKHIVNLDKGERFADGGIAYKDAVAQFNEELREHSAIKELAKNYNKTPIEIVKMLQTRISTKGNRSGKTTQVSIDLTDRDSNIKVKHTKKFADGGNLYSHQIGKYVRAYYNESISNDDNGYQVNLMFYNNQDDDDYFDEEFITTNSPEEAEKLADKINEEGVEKFMPKNKYANGGEAGKTNIRKVNEEYYEDAYGNGIALMEEEDGSGGYWFLDTLMEVEGKMRKLKSEAKKDFKSHIAKNYIVVKQFPTEKKSFYAEGGAVDLDYSDILNVLKTKIDDSIDEMPSDYENAYNFKGEEVEHESRDGFIPYTDGGYEAVWFEYLDGMWGAGKTLPTKPLNDEMNRQIDYNLDTAKESFVDEYPEIVEELGIENIDYNSLYEAGYGEEAEMLSSSEMEMMGEDTIMMQVSAFYYTPENDRAVDGKHTIRLFGDVNLESPYHRAGNLDDSYEFEFTFNSIDELETEMAIGIVKILSWFNGDMYNDSDAEMKVRRMEEGGEAGDDENFEYWIYQNYPTFDIDTFHLQEFLEEHYENSLTYNENFKNLQEWLDDDSENDDDEYADGGRITKYVAVYVVQGNYGQGFEDLTAHDNRKDAIAEMRVYVANESYPHRVIERRVLRSDYEKGNYAEGGEAGDNYGGSIDDEIFDETGYRKKLSKLSNSQIVNDIINILKKEYTEELDLALFYYVNELHDRFDWENDVYELKNQDDQINYKDLVEIIATKSNKSKSEIKDMFNSDSDKYAGGGRIDKMDKFISELAKKNTKEFSVNEYHDFRNKKYAIGVARYYFTDNDGSFSKFDTKLGNALNIDFETQGDSNKYAEGGETYVMTNDTYVNIFLSRGFTEKRSAYGLRFFEHKPTGIFITYDQTGMQTPVIISKNKSGEESIYEGNTIREVKQALDNAGVPIIKEGIDPTFAEGGSIELKTWREDGVSENEKFNFNSHTRSEVKDLLKELGYKVTEDNFNKLHKKEHFDYIKEKDVFYRNDINNKYADGGDEPYAKRIYSKNSWEKISNFLNKIYTEEQTDLILRSKLMRYPEKETYAGFVDFFWKYEEKFDELLKENGLEDKDEEEYAEGGEVEDWMEEALASLIEETGNESLDITMVSNSGNEFFAGNDNEEYRVFKSEDDAELTAEDEVREDLEESPENFNFEFLMNNVYANDFITEELKKMNYSYVEDIASESDKKYTNRLIAEMVENGLLDEDDAKSGNAEELADDLKSVYVDLLTEEQLEGGSIDFDYFINNYGEEETLKMFIENNVIDIDEASKDAVQTDGIAHFLSSYDGETLYLSDGYVAYRNN